MIVRGSLPGTAPRDREVVALHHPDGTPPYDVRWADTRRVAVHFPGPDARSHHCPSGKGGEPLTVALPDPLLLAD
ncbi:DUF1918 domain-containing protein [Kitasatospora sp. CMC57]|uniref:DUF1918 domain-containing protein n=1 Tax=Kitasatospora sp. CMC57 TaxID=3231513 RepID=UPI0038B525CB